MDVCDPHNLIDRPAEPELRFGIRICLPPGVTFARLVGADWDKFHWYATAKARDEAMEDMSHRHLYSRDVDRLTLIFEAVERK